MDCKAVVRFLTAIRLMRHWTGNNIALLNDTTYIAYDDASRLMIRLGHHVLFSFLLLIFFNLKKKEKRKKGKINNKKRRKMFYESFINYFLVLFCLFFLSIYLFIYFYSLPFLYFIFFDFLQFFSSDTPLLGHYRRIKYPDKHLWRSVFVIIVKG